MESNFPNKIHRSVFREAQKEIRKYLRLDENSLLSKMSDLQEKCLYKGARFRAAYAAGIANVSEENFSDRDIDTLILERYASHSY